MAMLKSVLILAFCIGWVSAAENDIEEKFQEFFSTVKNSIEDIWNFVREAANTGIIRINQLFTVRKLPESRQHKYDGVVSDSETAPESTSSTLSPTTVESSILPNTTVTTATTTTTESPAEPKESSLGESSNSDPGSFYISQDLDSSNTNYHQSQDESADNTHSSDIQANECEESPEKSGKSDTEPSEHSENVIPAIDTNSALQSEAVDAQEVVKPEETPVQPIQQDESVQTESVTMLNSIPEKYEYEEHVKGAAKTAVVYQQQNLIILFLFFLMFVMGVYFFLLSKTRNHCPTIVIGELNGNLKPTIKK